MTPDLTPATISTFRLRRRTPGSFLLVPCPQIGRSLRCQGQLEAAAAVILSACSLVQAIQEQPLSIWYAWRETVSGVQFQLLTDPPRHRRDGETRLTYIVPDFLVTMADSSRRLVEVKPSSKLDRPLVQRKLAVAAAYARQQGWTFHVVTEQQLHSSPLLANLRLLARYRSVPCDAGGCDAIVQQVLLQPRTLGELLDASDTETLPVAVRRTQLLHLLAIGRLDADLQAAPLSDQTLLSHEGTFPWDPFVSLWGPSGCSTDAPSGSSVSPPSISSSPST